MKLTLLTFLSLPAVMERFDNIQSVSFEDGSGTKFLVTDGYQSQTYRSKHFVRVNDDLSIHVDYLD